MNRMGNRCKPPQIRTSSIIYLMRLLYGAARAQAAAPYRFTGPATSRFCCAPTAPRYIYGRCPGMENRHGYQRERDDDGGERSSVQGHVRRGKAISLG